MRWPCVATVLLGLACQPFDELGMVGAGDALIAASETRFFSLYGASTTEVEIVLARDGTGTRLELEGRKVEGLLLPADDYCLLPGIIAAVAAHDTGTYPLCQSGLVQPQCRWPCGGKNWKVTVR